MDDKIHILLTITDSYAAYCAVTIVSIFENNKENDFCVHIICADLSKENKNKLEHLFKKYGQVIDIIKPDLQRFQAIVDMKDKMPSKYHVSAFYRLFAADWLPENIDRVIYLDCDLIVTGNFFPLWEEEMNENISLCATHDFVRIEDYHRLKIYKEQHTYFNTGVLLINLAYWRKHSVGQQLVDYICSYPERILMADQDSLNVVSVGKVKYLHPRWNTMVFYFAKSEHLKRHVWYDDWNMIQEAIKSPYVIHFANNSPWHKGRYLPWRDEWMKYASMTGWEEIKTGYKGGFMGRCKLICKKNLRLLIGMAWKSFREKHPVSPYK